MTTYKNIRIKMKGGKSRLQRVKVLASGKYKFVKNLAKRALKSPTRRTRRKSNPARKRGVRRMARKKNKRRGGKSLTRTAFKFIRLGALIAPGASVIVDPSLPTPNDKIRRAFLRYTGFDYGAPEYGFQAHRLVEGWGPFLMACLATYGIPKLTSIIRKL